MRRNSASENSSFDLFLDTVCNAFGGIVFFAILLALLVQARTVSQPKEVKKPHVATDDEVRAALLLADELDSQYMSLLVSLEHTPVRLGTQDDSELREVNAEIQKARQLLAAHLQKQLGLTRQLTEVVAETANQQRENDALVTQLEAAKEVAAEQRDKYAKMLEAKQKEMRLPRTRLISGQSSLLLLRYGRVFLAHRTSLATETFNRDHVETTGDYETGLTVVTRRDAGWQIDAPAGEAEIDRALDEAARYERAVRVAVWPSDYDKFDWLLEKLIRRNLYYELWPQTEGKNLVLYRGSGASSVQ